MTGDFYRSTGYPNIDRANGGTMNGMLAGFDAIVALARPDTKIVPGHGLVVDKTAVAAHKAMMMAVRDKVAVLVAQNKTQDEVVAAKVTAEFDSKVTGATPQTADRFVGQLYQELKK
jgi:glyoxylase-like metal-dependent hydrolase (beta-lactamase superfamily II)